MGEILTKEGRQGAADDVVKRLKEVIRQTDNPKIRQQAEQELKKWEKVKGKL